MNNYIKKNLNKYVDSYESFRKNEENKNNTKNNRKNNETSLIIYEKESRVCPKKGNNFFYLGVS